MRMARLDQRRVSVAERPVVATCVDQTDEDVLAPQIEALIQLVDPLLMETALLLERAASAKVIPILHQSELTI